MEITRRRTLIEEHPWLATLFGAPHPTRTLLTAVPLVAFLLWTGRSLTGHAGAAALAGGIVYWTFAEYALHRFFYHWRPRRPGLRRLVESFHVYHHRAPTDRSVWNAGPLLVLPLTGILALPVLGVLRSTEATAAVMAGAALAYVAYEWAHYLVHARRFRRGPLAYMQRFHLHHHHRDGRRCFGVTNPFWDIVFRTDAEVRRG